MYTKDLSFLLRLLQSSRQSGTLFVEGPSQQHESAWQGMFRMENGIVRSCVVFNKQSRKVLFHNEDAINWLIAQGKLEWFIEENTQWPQALPSPSHIAEESRGGHKTGENILLSPLWEKRRREVFTRTIHGESAPVHALPSRDHRQVFALVDGRRSTEEIVRLLQKPPEIILKLLQELQNAGFIV